MSETISCELLRLVETVVRPIRARHSRKRRMRDELLGHLSAIYEEELQRLGDEKLAMAQVRSRFGEPAAVSREICKSLSWREPIHYVLEQQGWRKPRESILHFVCKHVLFCTAVWVGLMGLGLIRLMMPPAGTPGEFRVLVKLFVVMGIVSTIFSSAFVIVLTQLSEALHGSESCRSWRRVAVWGGLAILLVPGLMGLLWGVLLSDYTLPVSAIVASFVASPLTLGLALLTSRQVQAERSYEEEWASLEIVG